jgi:hypothetical protein
MKISRKNRLFIEMKVLAERALEDLTEDEIQEFYGSDYYCELKNYIKYEAFSLWESGELYEK